MNGPTFAIALVAVMALAGCAANISGTVRVAAAPGQAAADGKLEGIVINVINTTGSLENASHSVKTDSKGRFSVDAKQLKPGTYKFEANEPGFLPVSKTIEFKDTSRELELELKPLPTSGSRSFRNMQSDRDKIINPGEVNIQPPSM